MRRSILGAATAVVSTAALLGSTPTVSSANALALSWTAQASGVNVRLMSVSFANQTDGWAVGMAGTLLHTVNGGRSWSKEAVPPMQTTHFLRGVHAVDAAHAWVVGGSNPMESDILVTADGGAHWTAQSWTPAAGHILQNLIAVDFVDLLHGWAVGGTNAGASATPLILRTVDGGVHWEDATPAAAAGYLLAAVDFVSPTEGWATGGTINVYTGAIFHSVDGGRTWALQPVLPTSATAFLPALAMTDASHGWVAGGGLLGAVLLHYDGVAWTAQTPGVSDTGIRGLSALDPWTAWGAADRGFAPMPSGNSEVIATTDGSAWAVSSGSASIPDLQALDFVDGCHGWAVGDNGAILAASCAARSGSTGPPSTVGTGPGLPGTDPGIPPRLIWAAVLAVAASIWGTLSSGSAPPGSCRRWSRKRRRCRPTGGGS